MSKGRKEDLQNAVRNGLQSFSLPNDQELAADWCEVWDKGFLATQLENLGSYPSQWITTIGQGGIMIPEEIQPAVLVSRSSAMCARSAIQSLIEQIPSAQIPEEHPPIFWSPPDFTAWRAAPSLYDMVDNIRSRFCGGKSGVVMLPRVEDSQRRAFQNMYDTKRGQSSGNFPFDACVALAGNTLPQSIEIIFQPGLWAICIIHASDMRCNYPVPVGVGTANPDAVHAIGEELRFYLSKCRSADVLTFDRGVAGVGAQEPEPSAAFLSYIQDSFRV
ncbi:hypothetical protein [Primorskyibacter flagellatus]|uniref:Uncharacterized protein n=1 Tax=Primorskyibacter flagellatus TaxID=1387277 RepID=A0A1W2BVJ9_9RHOB|nr:hypothetical protein [Primorskyibacter flagellatus]SMC76764.1 hypothetical protein SAMN06295998_10510 [Primorskyibacter flagellatus]